MTDEFIRINIAFRPPADIAEAAAKLSAEIAQKEEAHFVIDSQNFYPHMTIYSPEYPAQNLGKVLSALGEILKKFSEVKFIFKKVTTEEGWIGIEFELTDEIKKIHESIVGEMNALREGHLREKYLIQDGSEHSAEQKENIQKYGLPSLMGLYIPHLTLTRLKDEKIAEKLTQEINWPIPEFKADKLGAFKMGDHGTCIELIQEFKLG